jgi:hypothetical protein
MKIILNLLFIFSLISCKKESFFPDFNTVKYYTLKKDSLINYQKVEDSIAVEIFNKDYPKKLDDKDFYK